MLNVPIVKSGVPINITLINLAEDRFFEAVEYNQYECSLFNLSINDFRTSRDKHIYDKIPITYKFRTFTDISKGNPSVEDMLAQDMGSNVVNMRIIEYSIQINKILDEGIYTLRLEYQSNGNSSKVEGIPFIVSNNYTDNNPEVYNISCILHPTDRFSILSDDLRDYNILKHSKDINKLLIEIGGIDNKIRDTVNIEIGKLVLDDNEALTNEYINSKVEEISNQLVPGLIDEALRGTSLDFVKKLIKANADTTIRSYIDEVIPTSVRQNNEEYVNKVDTLERDIAKFKLEHKSSNVTISDDGFWVINGVKTNVKAVDSSTPNVNEIEKYHNVQWVPRYVDLVNLANEYNTNFKVGKFATNTPYINGNFYSSYGTSLLVIVNIEPKFRNKDLTIYIQYNNTSRKQNGNDPVVDMELFPIEYENSKGERVIETLTFSKNKSILEFKVKDINSNIFIKFNKMYNIYYLEFGFNQIRLKEDNATPLVQNKTIGYWDEKPVNPIDNTTYICTNLSVGNNVMLIYYQNSWHTIWGARIDGSTENAKSMYDEALKSIISK